MLKETTDHVPEIRNKKAPTWLEDGYSGDIYCKVCGQLIKKGKTLPKKWDSVAAENRFRCAGA